MKRRKAYFCSASRNQGAQTSFPSPFRCCEGPEPGEFTFVWLPSH